MNEVTKFSAVFHPNGCFSYILGRRGNSARQFEKTTLFLVGDRIVFSQK